LMQFILRKGWPKNFLISWMLKNFIIIVDLWIIFWEVWELILN
jgi:hypothetical protein